MPLKYTDVHSICISCRWKVDFRLPSQGRTTERQHRVGQRQDLVAGCRRANELQTFDDSEMTFRHWLSILASFSFPFQNRKQDILDELGWKSHEGSDCYPEDPSRFAALASKTVMAMAKARVTAAQKAEAPTMAQPWRFTSCGYLQISIL